MHCLGNTGPNYYVSHAPRALSWYLLNPHLILVLMRSLPVP